MTEPSHDPHGPGARIVSIDELNELSRQVIPPETEVVREVEPPLLRTPEEWSAIKGIEVRDPDGWRNEGKDWAEPVTEGEFTRLCGPSTIRPVPAEELIAMAPPAEESGRVVSESIAFATGGLVAGHAAADAHLTQPAPLPEWIPVQGYCARCGQASLVLGTRKNRVRCTYDACPDQDASARVLDRGQMALSFLNLTPTPNDVQRAAQGLQGDGVVLVPGEQSTAHRTLSTDTGPVYKWRCPACKTPHESRTPDMVCRGKPGNMHRPEYADPDLALT